MGLALAGKGSKPSNNLLEVDGEGFSCQAIRSVSLRLVLIG